MARDPPKTIKAARPLPNDDPRRLIWLAIMHAKTTSRMITTGRKRWQSSASADTQKTRRLAHARIATLTQPPNTSTVRPVLRIAWRRKRNERCNAAPGGQ